MSNGWCKSGGNETSDNKYQGQAYQYTECRFFWRNGAGTANFEKHGNHRDYNFWKEPKRSQSMVIFQFLIGWLGAAKRSQDEANQSDPEEG
jgi:hypothetical protein